MADIGTLPAQFYRRLPRIVLIVVLLFGTVTCEKRPADDREAAVSAVAPVPIELPTTQAPRLNDQPVIRPPSLSPLTSPIPVGSASRPWSPASGTASAAATSTDVPLRR